MQRKCKFRNHEREWRELLLLISSPIVKIYTRFYQLFCEFVGRNLYNFPQELLNETSANAFCSLTETHIFLIFSAISAPTLIIPKSNSTIDILLGIIKLLCNSICTPSPTSSNKSFKLRTYSLKTDPFLNKCYKWNVVIFYYISWYYPVIQIF